MMSDDAINPRDNQVAAHTALMGGLAQNDRVQAHMCCGSGKTFSQAFLARDIIAQSGEAAPTVVCFVPNRDLIRQNAANFRKVFGDTVDYLGVCSAQEGREPEGRGQEGGERIEMTTDRTEIRSRLAGGLRPKIVFSTYQSARTTRDAMVQDDGSQSPVLLGLFDEAHRTAGEKNRDSLFAFGLFDDNMEIAKRAFFTATPRISESEGPSREGSVLSMADQEIYGPRVYEYTFSEAVRDKNVVPYDLWAPVITLEELSRIGVERGLSEGTDMKDLLAELAISRVMQETGQVRFLTYHRRIEDSRNFADRLEGSYGPLGFTIGHIDGSTASGERLRLLGAMESGKAILTNCKAFVEGVDAPGLQGIAFVDPKSSVVDIVQAVGRPTRWDKNDENKRASIIVPIVYDPNDTRSASEQAKDQGFETLIRVVQALGASDDRMAAAIQHGSRQAGRSGSFEAAGLAEAGQMKLLGLGENMTPEDLAAIGSRIGVISLTAARDTFAQNVGRLEAHLETHTELPTAKSDPELYRWARRVRLQHSENRLDQGQARILDRVEGWRWTGPREQPHGYVAHIQSFYKRNGRVPGPDALGSAERELGQELREAEKYTLGGESAHLLKTRGRVAGERAQAIAGDPLGREMLFRHVASGDSRVSGHILRNDAAQDGGPEFIFQPLEDGDSNRSMTFFRSGIRSRHRAIGLHLDEGDRERFAALEGRDHTVTISLERAGKDPVPFRDGKIAVWHDAMIDRGDRPGKTASVSFFVNRLMDRKVLGLPAYTSENIAAGLVAPGEVATDLSGSPDKVSAGHMVKLAKGLRNAAFTGAVSDKALARIDAAPGFSWVDPANASGHLAPAVAGIVSRHGAEALCSLDLRKGDNVVANTLRAVDEIVARDRDAKDVAGDLAIMREAGYLRDVATFLAARKRQPLISSHIQSRASKNMQVEQ